MIYAASPDEEHVDDGVSGANDLDRQWPVARAKRGASRLTCSSGRRLGRAGWGESGWGLVGGRGRARRSTSLRSSVATDPPGATGSVPSGYRQRDRPRAGHAPECLGAPMRGRVVGLKALRRQGEVG